MNVSAAIADPPFLRAKRERDKQDVRDKRDSKFRVRSSENFGLRTSALQPSRLARPAFPASLLGNRLFLMTDTTENSQEAAVCLPQR